MVITRTGGLKGKRACFNDRMVVITATPLLSRTWRVVVLNNCTWEITKDHQMFLVHRKYLTGYSKEEAVAIHEKAKGPKRDSYVGRLYLLGKLYIAIVASNVFVSSGTAVTVDKDGEKNDRFFWRFLIVLLIVGCNIPNLLSLLAQATSWVRIAQTTTTTTSTSSSAQTTSTTTTSSTTQTEPAAPIPRTPTLATARPTASGYMHITPSGECWHSTTSPALGSRSARYRACKICSA